MTAKNLLLAGAGGHAVSCIDVIEKNGLFTIAGLLGLPDEKGKKVLGYEVIGTEAEAAALLKRNPHALVTVGQITTPDARIRIFDLLRRAGFDMPAIVSPLAYVSPRASIGAGTVVMHGAIVNAGATIGDNCIVNTCALVEHDAVVGDHCHISTGATLNGGARVGQGSFIGSMSAVKEGARIGARCIVGMGEAVLSDCPDGSRFTSGKLRT